jgi:glycosyltransferase involved in cell wall biosynthesis
MKMLIVNKFLFLNGGSEACMFDGARLLKERGHSVAFLAMADPRNVAVKDPVYLVSHVDFNRPDGVRGRARAAARMLYSFEARVRTEEAIRTERPDLALLHNVYHQLSPAVLEPLARHRIPAVMTLHDYKVVCPVYTLFTRGRPCERCRGGRYYWCAVRRCARGSRAASALAAAEAYLHRTILGSYERVAAFISPSRFLASKLEEMGFAGRVQHIPNFLDLRGVKAAPRNDGDTFAYVGRLTLEKGLKTLVAAMEGMPARCQIIGDGPLAGDLHAMVAARGMENVTFTGHLAGERLADGMRRARAIVLPSLWYENSPRSVIEAFALGKPVVGARVGGIPELVRDGDTGLTFSPGSVEELRGALLSLLGDEARVQAMGSNARRLVEREHGAALYYRRLMMLCRSVAAGA